MNPITRYLALKVVALHKIGIELKTPPIIEDRPKLKQETPPRPFLKEKG